MSLRGKNILVLGLGETGLSMARYAARCGAARVCVADTRAAPPGSDDLRASVPRATLLAGPFSPAIFAGVDLVAISPGVALAEPAVQHAIASGVEVVGDIELFARALPEVGRPKVIAVTGTNGKSTVTALAGELCRALGLDCEVAGNISPAVLDALMRREDAGRMPEVWVLELSSYQLETTASLAADAAAMLNLSEDHLDRYRSIDEYGAAKARIFQGRGLQVLNRDDPASMAMRIAGRECVTFGLEMAPRGDDFGLLESVTEYMLARGSEPIVEVGQLQLAGLHNAANALAALALVSIFEPNRDALVTGLRRFRGLPHRVEPVGEADDVRYFDDSKGTNVGSTVAALDGFARQLSARGGKVVLIAGGDGKGQDFTPLAAPVAQYARAVVLIGRDAPRIRAALQGTSVPMVAASDMEHAVQLARESAHAGDAVLLSPACASLDMFDNYAHRARVFCDAVRGLELIQ